MSLKLHIDVSEDQVKFLKEQGYNLFLAKLVHGQDKANVIWKSNSAYITTNKFEWQPVYAISGSETVEPGALVEASTKVKPIGYGQSIEIDKDGNITNAANPVTPGQPFKLTNKSPDTSFSAAVYAVDPSKPGSEPDTPFYVSKSLEKDFSVSILPIETVIVWFGQAEKTSTIIADYSGPSHKVVYSTGESTHTVKWTKAGWEDVN